MKNDGNSFFNIPIVIDMCSLEKCMLNSSHFESYYYFMNYYYLEN